MTRLERIGVFFRSKLAQWKTIYESVRGKDRLERTERDRRAKCPACGHGGKRGWFFRRYKPDVKPHELKWSEMHEALLHTCPVCGAVWGDRPIVQYRGGWKVEIPEASETQDIETTARG